MRPRVALRQGLATLVAVLVVTSVLVVGIGPVGTASGATQKADVVFVFDETGSMGTQADALKDEVENVANELDSSGIDARYGLVTYEDIDQTAVDTELSDDPADLVAGLDEFDTFGGTEHASHAINFALAEMDYRSDAQKIIVVITDEDDDSSSSVRDTAITNLNEQNACLVAVSPDNDDDDEMKWVSQQVDCGDWTDIGSTSFTTVVTDLIGIIEEVTGDGPTVAADFEVVEKPTDPITAYVGEPVTAEFVVENQGGGTGTYHALLTTMNAVHYSERVELAPGESHTFAPDVAFDEIGSYNLRLNYRTLATVEVEQQPPDPLDPADIELVDATVTRSTVWDGESYDVVAVVENVGNETGQAPVTFSDAPTNGSANATVNVTESVVLDPGETAEVRHTVSVEDGPAEATTGSWYVNDVHAGSVTVLPADEVESGVVDAYTVPQSVAPGEEYEVVSVLHNAADEEQLFSLYVAEEGEEWGSLSMVWVGAGETVEISRTYTAPDEAGSVVWQVNDRSTELTVVENATVAA